jgi:O-acetyl-ADP-ribose deacetylase
MSNEELSRVDIDGAEIVVVRGDITAEAVDAVVNAANERLQHGGGVAAAIAKAGGTSIQEQSDAWVEQHGRLGPGTAAVTGAGEMPARWVIHVAGPVYDEGSDDNERLLRTAIRAALDAAAGEGARSVALPAISAGTYGYPHDEATSAIADEVANWVRGHGDLDEVRLVGFDEGTTAGFEAGVQAVQEGS